MGSLGKRLTILTVVLLALAAIRFNVGGQLLTHAAFALERGRIQANSAELQRIPEELAGAEKIGNAFRMVAKVVSPSVVHIRVAGGDVSQDGIDQLRRQLREMMGERFSEEEFQDMIRRRSRQTVGSGSGIVIGADGRILTNNHVIEGRSDLRVTLHDGRDYEARVVGRDPKTDLAVIKIDATDLHPLRLGDSNKIEVGDWVLAVGAPFGLQQTVTHGIVSAKGRSRIDGIAIPYQDFIQTDAAINPGNSGGPLVNLRGELVGVNTAIATNGDSFNAGVAFSIPSNTAAAIAERLSRDGEVVRGWLGISMSELEPRAAALFDLKGRGGVLVDAIFEGSPADAAGMLVDDVILTVNGTNVSTPAELQRLVADVAPGKLAQVEVARGGETRGLKITVGRRPDNENSITRNAIAVRAIDDLQVGALTLTPTRARLGGFEPSDQGVVVVESRSESSPLRPGDVIVSANGVPVTNVSALTNILARHSSRKPLELEVRRANGAQRTVSIRKS